MITYKSFSFLPQEEQAKYLWKEGVSLNLIRHTPGLFVELYSLNQFYVEIFFDKDNGEPLFLKSFEHMKGLDPYFSSPAWSQSVFNSDGLMP